MGKVKKRHSLKWSFVKYIPLCVLFSWIGVYAIGIGTNHLQDWYEERYQFQLVYWLIGNGQALWMILWVLLCVGIAGTFFYNRELKKPITMLMDASRKISENNLDFHLEYGKDDEMGMLCSSFEEMRQELDKNNREMWSLLEERKRLNQAFSHDLRTPLTVLRGYTDFLNKYVPEGTVSGEKLLEIISMINGQVMRLENYTEKMNSVQKLSELVPDRKTMPAKELLEHLQKSGEMLCGEREFFFETQITDGELVLDEELVTEVFENLVSNAARFSRRQIKVSVLSRGEELWIVAEDDGEGFSEEGLRFAASPFYRGDKENDKTHFGMGLYICKVLCERCDGRLIVENGSAGGKVTAVFLKS